MGTVTFTRVHVSNKCEGFILLVVVRCMLVANSTVRSMAACTWIMRPFRVYLTSGSLAEATKFDVNVHTHAYTSKAA